MVSPGWWAPYRQWGAALIEPWLHLLLPVNHRLDQRIRSYTATWPIGMNCDWTRPPVVRYSHPRQCWLNLAIIHIFFGRCKRQLLIVSHAKDVQRRRLATKWVNQWLNSLAFRFVQWSSATSGLILATLLIRLQAQIKVGSWSEIKLLWTGSELLIQS